MWQSPRGEKPSQVLSYTDLPSDWVVIPSIRAIRRGLSEVRAWRYDEFMELSKPIERMRNLTVNHSYFEALLPRVADYLDLWEYPGKAVHFTTPIINPACPRVNAAECTKGPYQQHHAQPQSNRTFSNAQEIQIESTESQHIARTYRIRILLPCIALSPQLEPS